MEENMLYYQRKQLKEEGKNICYGEICGPSGNIQDLDKFNHSAKMCDECVDRVTQRKILKSEGKNICFGEHCNGIIYDINMFIKKGNICKKCDGEKNKQYIQQNGRKYIKVKNAYKSGKECVTCGEIDIRVIEFDHIIGKKLITIGKSNNSTLILSEIEKCQLLCCFCHRQKTYAEKDVSRTIEELYIKYAYADNINVKNGKKCRGPLCNGTLRDISNFSIKGTVIYSRCDNCTKFSDCKKRIERSTYVNNIKIGIGKCNDCDRTVDETNFMCFDFHHTGDKIKNVSMLIMAPITKLNDEIAKCKLLCCNCHRIRTIEEFNHKHYSS